MPWPSALAAITAMCTKDVSILSDWLVISKDESGKIYVPWDEIDVRMALAKRAA